MTRAKEFLGISYSGKYSEWIENSSELFKHTTWTEECAGMTCEDYEVPKGEGVGIDVINGNIVNMVIFGIIDPLLVTKTALKNAVSVVNTIISADCVISNIRVNEVS